MSILLVMLPLILGTGLVALALFVWAVYADQFEDLKDAKHRIFFED
jgi:cbb3-type cytochrome oxidase maturation protein